MTAQQQPHIVRLADVTAQAWKNGGGLTRELLVWPSRDTGNAKSPNTTSDWCLRVSVADITRDGPFSAYPGIDRGFAVLSGTGVRLELNGRTRTLTPDDEPIEFPGEDAPYCGLLDDATQDLNLMVRRTQGRLGIVRARIDALLSGPYIWRAIFVNSAARVETGAQQWSLEPQTLLWQTGTQQPWRLLSGHAAYWLYMQPD